ncbi:hypothetical protein [Marinisporobacter balticus]|nr:hypothetical protein [Marinisporobacter balticus]
MKMMKKAHYPCTKINSMRFDNVEDQERRQKIETLCIEESLLNGDIKSTLDHIKHQKSF